jgi:hypothetical protein
MAIQWRWYFILGVDTKLKKACVPHILEVLVATIFDVQAISVLINPSN